MTGKAQGPESARASTEKWDRANGTREIAASYLLTVVAGPGPDAGRALAVEPSSPTPLLVGTSAACELVVSDGRGRGVVQAAGGRRAADGCHVNPGHADAAARRRERARCGSA